MVTVSAGVGLTLDEDDVDHKFFIPVGAITAYGPELVSDRDPWGPEGHTRLICQTSQQIGRLKG